MAVGLFSILLIPLLGLAAILHIGEGVEAVSLAPYLFFWSIVLFILGVALWEAIDLVRNKGLSCCGKGRIMVAAGLCLVPWALLFTEYFSVLGFMVPFFHNWIVMVILAAAALWQVLGFILIIRAKSPMPSFLVVLFFILPANFVIVFSTLIGPAVITVVNAFCQIPPKGMR